MTRSSCVKCKKGAANCKCPTTCNQCLVLAALGSDGSCNCCKHCGQPQVSCEADDGCEVYEPSGSTPQHPCSPPPPSNQTPTTASNTARPPMSMFPQQKPPDLNLVFVDPSMLKFYCSLLRRWSKVGGFEPKYQGDVFTINAATTCPNLAQEIDKKIGNKITDNPNAVELIIKFLEERYGVDKQVDICETFKKFFFSKRTPGMDLVSYVNQFEINFSEMEKLEQVTISEFYLALFLFVNAQLSDTEFSILYNKLDFEKAMSDKDKSILDRTKALLRRSQYGKQMNNGVPSTGNNTNAGVNNGNSSKSSKTLLSDMFDVEVDDETSAEIKELVQTYVAGKRDKKVPRDEKGKIFKCHFCLCKCPRSVRCDCECTKHPYWKCKFKDKGNKHKKSDDKDDKDGNSVKKSYITHLSNFSDSLNGKTFMAKEQSSNQKGDTQVLKNFLMFDEAIPQECEGSNQNESSELIHVQRDLSLLANESLDFEKNELSMVLDTAAPSTLVGLKNFKKIFNLYPKVLSHQFEFEDSTKVFEFGGGETTKSVGKVRLPMYVKDDRDRMHTIWIQTEIVAQDIIFLMGGSSLEKAGAVIDCGDKTVKFKAIPGANFPLLNLDSGHIALQFFSMTENEAEEAARHLLDDCSTDFNDVLYYLQTVDDPKIELVLLNALHLDTNFHKKKEKKKYPELTKKDVLKLHHFYGHASALKLSQKN